MAGASCKLDNKVSSEITMQKARIRAAVNEFFGNIHIVTDGKVEPLRKKLKGYKGKKGLIQEQKELSLKLQNKEIDLTKSTKDKIVYKKIDKPLSRDKRKETREQLDTLNSEIKAINQDIQDFSRQKKEGKNKYKLVKAIRNKVISRMDKFAETKA